VNSRALCLALLILGILAGVAAAAEPETNLPAPTGAASLTPYNTAICTYACYCGKPIPCVSFPCDGICVRYCGKPIPCVTFPCDGICVPYCCKPMPCLCNPLAQPCNCAMPACYGVGK
jgi:hypothetical protein